MSASELKSGSRLERVLAAGHFAVTAEIGPPKSADPSPVIEKGEVIRDYVDAVNVTDCQTAIVRMSSIGGATILIQQGIEPVVQMTCRDRNRIGIQADLLGAAAIGVKNVLLLTGDHQKFGDHPMAKGVFDLDSIQLVDMVRTMRDEGKLNSGEELKVAPRFFIGAVENPFASPVEFRARRLGKKADAGADFIQTQIIYDLERFREFMAAVRDLGLHQRLKILAGVTPLKSARMANYMATSVPGLKVPAEVLERMEKAADPKAEGMAICIETVEAVREIEGVVGIHIMAVGWEGAVPEIVERLGLHPRPEV